MRFPTTIAALANLRQILLLIPDLETKSTAVSTLQKLKGILPVEALVWNRQAGETLRKQSVPYQPMEPWILQMSNSTMEQDQPKPRAILRPSGSGVDPQHFSVVPDLVQRYTAAYLHGFDVFAESGAKQHDRSGKLQMNFPAAEPAGYQEE